jgi:hypothetical protein
MRSVVRAPVLASAFVARAVALPGVASAAGHPAHGHGRVAKITWLSVNTKSKTVTLTLIAGYNSAVSGFNFNGYGNGKMTISVPLHYRVNVVFTNKGSTIHSAVFVPYSERNASGSFKMAFAHASTPSPTGGTAIGKTVKFSFVASKTGTYAIVCAVPGHDALGMWDVFKVTSGGKASISYSH